MTAALTARMRSLHRRQLPGVSPSPDVLLREGIYGLRKRVFPPQVNCLYGDSDLISTGSDRHNDSIQNERSSANSCFHSSFGHMPFSPAAHKGHVVASAHPWKVQWPPQVFSPLYPVNPEHRQSVFKTESLPFTEVSELGQMATISPST